MMNKWWAARLLDFRISAWQDAEANAVIEAKTGQKIKCFVDYFDIQEIKNIEIGSNVNISLDFMCLQIEKNKNGTKKIIDLQKHANSVNQYKLVGQVMDKSEDKIILDCGFPIEIKATEKNIKKGAWIEATGRINLHFTKWTNGF
ncbi:MAG: hypothetical protein WC462_02010 [archaeon]